MMKKDNKIKLFLVDDDALFLKLLAIEFLDSADFVVETYATGELCVKHLSNNPDVVILDYHLDGINRNAMNGISPCLVNAFQHRHDRANCIFNLTFVEFFYFRK